MLDRPNALLKGLTGVLGWLTSPVTHGHPESRREYERLRESEARFRSLIEQVPALTYIWDLRPAPGEAPHIYTSPQSFNIFGFGAEEWEEDPDLWERQLHPDDRTIAVAATERSEETGEPFSLDYRMLAKDGRTVWVHDEGVVTEHDANGRPKIMQGVLIDITLRKDLEEQLRQRTEELEQMSMTDSLTGLLNARGFELLATHELKVAARDGRAPRLLFLDLDDLKGINDTFGHAVGDVALKDFAGILRDTFRGSDIVARLGGDEFCVLLTSGDLSERQETSTARLLKTIGRHGEDVERPYRIRASIGAAAYDPNVHASLRELMDEADRAMYEVKRERRRARSGRSGGPMPGAM